MAAPSTAEQPLPVRTVARHISEWVSRLGKVWVEGQVTEVSKRPGTVFLTLRDPVADVSLRLTCSRGVCDAVVPPLADGARVVVHAKPDFYLSRGTLSLVAYEIRPVGVGELLARLERLKGVLAQEGLFAASRKKPLPFLPGVVGLVTGRASAAERDVLENARRRWPAVRFDVREVAVQGHLAVEQVVGALRSLDAAPEVDVIVLARGGGSVEDLLPFSDEALCRAVAACRTPVVSAIGHEPDSPLRRPRRRRALLDPDRRRQARRARRRRGALTGARAARPGPAGGDRPRAARAGGPARRPQPPRASPTPTSWSAAAPTRWPPCATGPAAAPAPPSPPRSATSSTPWPGWSR